MQALKSLRQSRGLTQVQLAELAGLTPEHLSNVERGRYIPKVTTLQRLAKALRVHAAVLLDADFDKKAS